MTFAPVLLHRARTAASSSMVRKGLLILSLEFAPWKGAVGSRCGRWSGVLAEATGGEREPESYRRGQGGRDHAVVRMFR